MLNDEEYTANLLVTCMYQFNMTQYKRMIQLAIFEKKIKYCTWIVAEHIAHYDNSKQKVKMTHQKQLRKECILKMIYAESGKSKVD